MNSAKGMGPHSLMRRRISASALVVNRLRNKENVHEWLYETTCGHRCLSVGLGLPRDSASKSQPQLAPNGNGGLSPSGVPPFGARRRSTSYRASVLSIAAREMASTKADTIPTIQPQSLLVGRERDGAAEAPEHQGSQWSPGINGRYPFWPPPRLCGSGRAVQGQGRRAFRPGQCRHGVQHPVFGKAGPGHPQGDDQRRHHQQPEGPVNPWVTGARLLEEVSESSHF